MNTIRSFLFLVFFPTSLLAQEDFLLRNGQRIVFLGDSNTFAGKFITYLDGYLFTRFPNQKFELINLGLPSETVTGLSEPDHPYPRPNVHDRLDKALEKSKPNVVVICYGMNDGVYYPYSDDRFKKYQEGILKVVEKVKKVGALPILMTPAPFDPKPLKDKVLDKNAEKYSWMRPYEKYDEEVLSFYSEWLLSLKEEKYLVADPHSAIVTHLTNMRKRDANYRVSGDGIHPDANGHALIFRELLLTLKAPAIVDQARFGGEVKDEKVSEFSDKDGVISFKWTTRIPMPYDPQWSKKLALDERITEKLNWHAIRGQFILAKKYSFFVNDQKIADITGEELTSGLNLLQFPDLFTNKRSLEMWKLVEIRQALLGRAWLSDVGHKRPDTPKGIPLEEAKKRAAEMETQIRKLAEPVELKIKFEPVEK